MCRKNSNFTAMNPKTLISPEEISEGSSARRTLISLDCGVISNPFRRLPDPVSFQLRQGECIAVVGPVGSGKSTLLKMITGGFYLREGTLRLDLDDESYRAIRFVEFDNAYSTTETQYYHQQRWQAFEREASPLAGELLGVAAGMNAEGTPDGKSAEGMPAGESAEGMPDGKSAEGMPAGEIAEGTPAGMNAEGMPKEDTGNTAGRQLAATQQDTKINPHKNTGGYIHENTDYQDDACQDKLSWQQRLFEILNIGPLLGKEIITLSSGELRRFSIARALLQRPQVLVLESPFIGLDPPTRQVLCDLLEQVLNTLGISIIMTLTDPDRIPQVATHVYYMDHGRLSAKMSASLFLNTGQKPSLSPAFGQSQPQRETIDYSTRSQSLSEIKPVGILLQTEAISAQPENRSGHQSATEVSTGHIDGLCAPILPRSGLAPASEDPDSHTAGRYDFRVGDDACGLSSDTIAERTSREAKQFFHEAEAFDKVVEMRNININYGERQIFRDLNWTVHSGERWNVTGPNGSGKSTLLSLVNADNPRAYSLDITLFDRRRGTGESIWDIKQHIGYLSSEMHSSFRENLPVLEIVRSGLGDRFGDRVPASGLGDRFGDRVPASGLGSGDPISVKPGGKLTEAQTDTDYRSTINYGSDLQQSPNNQTDSLQPHNTEDDYLLQWLRLFGAEHLAQRSYLTLSSGEQRYILLVRAFVKDPDLLILDEPFQGLDPALRHRAAAVIEAFCAAKNKTLIFVTHYLDEVPGVVTHTLQL